MGSHLTRDVVLTVAASFCVLGFGSFVFAWMLSQTWWVSQVAWKEHLHWLPPAVAFVVGSAGLLVTVAIW